MNEYWNFWGWASKLLRFDRQLAILEDPTAPINSLRACCGLSHAEAAIERIRV